MNKKFWSGKKVFLTGHTGFKGSWLSLWLQNAGAHVTGYSLPPPTHPNMFETVHVGKGMKTIIGDVRDGALLAKAMKEEKPEIVIHLAAQSIVRASYNDPVETYSTNVMGTVQLFEAVRKTESVRVVVNVTSDKCYENKEWLWAYRENDPMGGYDPYSNSKGCAELVTSAYRNSFFQQGTNGLRTAGISSVRAGNVLGGGDWTADQLVPDIMKSFMNQQPVQIRNPRAIRPWQFVLEPLSGYLRVAEKMWEGDESFSDAWNFGPQDDDAKPVAWIADTLSTLWGGNARWIQDAGEHPHEAHYLKLDSSKAKTILGWSPRMRLAQTLEWLVDWYKLYHEKGDLRRLTEEQMAHYEQLRII